MILNFSAGKPGGERIVGIALNFYAAILCAPYNNRAGVRAIHGARSCISYYPFFGFIHQFEFFRNSPKSREGAWE
jgi:hypothetical protein